MGAAINNESTTTELTTMVNYSQSNGITEAWPDIEPHDQTMRATINNESTTTEPTLSGKL